MGISIVPPVGWGLAPPRPVSSQDFVLGGWYGFVSPTRPTSQNPNPDPDRASVHFFHLCKIILNRANSPFSVQRHKNLTQSGSPLLYLGCP